MINSAIALLAITSVWLLANLCYRERNSISRGLNWLKSVHNAAKAERWAIYAGYCYLFVGFVVLGIHGIGALWEWMG